MKLINKCRFCNAELKHEFIDLGYSPASNSYLDDLNQFEIFYPLKVFICDKCFLVQIDEFKKSEEIFDDNYAYFSSYSTSWLKHCKNYVSMITEKLQLNSESYVIEIASNDGYLLQYFKKLKINCLGIEPTKCTAIAAREKGIKTLELFFGKDIANDLNKADLIIGNNVLAHVPDINDFVKGLRIALKSKGTITLEFPHILNLIKYNQFDTIYHEHYSYLSLMTVIEIFKKHGLKIYDVDILSTHGGSIRIYATHRENEIEITNNIYNLINEENKYGLNTLQGYSNLKFNAFDIKLQFVEFLIQAKKEGRTIVAYGAAAKGNTLLNFCGVKNDLIKFVVDKSPHKQNKYLPGSHIPIVDISIFDNIKPDYIIIFPWNLKDEIISELKAIKNLNSKFVTVIPELKIW